MDRLGPSIWVTFAILVVTHVRVYKPNPVFHQIPSNVVCQIQNNWTFNDFLDFSKSKFCFFDHDNVIFNCFPEKPIPGAIILHVAAMAGPAGASHVIFIEKLSCHSSVVGLSWLKLYPLVFWHNLIASSISWIPEIKVMFHFHLGWLVFNKRNKVIHRGLCPIEKIKVLVRFWIIHSMRRKGHHGIVPIVLCLWL